MFFDTHCHLNSEELFIKKDELIKEANENNVKMIVVPGYDYDSSKKVFELIKEKNIFGAIGLQPEEITKENIDGVFSLFSLIPDNPKIVAIGEIGLDYYWEKDKAKQEIQKQVFIKQIEIANKYKLPIIVHSRDALNDTLMILRKHKPLYGGIMHCYSGPKEMMNDFINLGMYISLGGPVTFKNARTPKEVALNIDLNYLLIETDSPYLTPHPYRGTQNAPKYVTLVAQEIANIRNEDISVIEKITTQNAMKVFKVKYEENN